MKHLINRVTSIMERHAKGAAMQRLFFRAPSTFAEAEEHCMHCGQRIRPGELIAEWNGDPCLYIQAACFDLLREEAAEQAAENAEGAAA